MRREAPENSRRRPPARAIETFPADETTRQSQTPEDFAYTSDTERIWAEIRAGLHLKLCKDEAWMIDSPRSELLWQAQARNTGIERGPLAKAKTTWADEGPLHVVWHGGPVPLTISAVRNGTRTSIRTRADLGTVHERHEDALTAAIRSGRMLTPVSTLAIVDGEATLLHSRTVDSYPGQMADETATHARRHAAHAIAIAHMLAQQGLTIGTHTGDPVRKGIDPGVTQHAASNTSKQADMDAGRTILSRENIEQAAAAAGCVASYKNGTWTLHDGRTLLHLTGSATGTPGTRPEEALSAIATRTAGNEDPWERWEAGEDVVGTRVRNGSTVRLHVLWPYRTLHTAGEEEQTAENTGRALASILRS